MTDDKLVVRNDDVEVSARGVEPEILANAAAIWKATDGTITKEQAIRAAYHFKTTGEVLGRDSYVATTGRTKGQVLEGYRAVQRTIKEPYQIRKYRELNEEEREDNKIKDGDMSMACEVEMLRTRRMCIEMGVEYYPIVGITVVRKGERLNVPATKTENWVLKKQARNDALRQIPGAAVDADEVLDAARADGLTLPDLPDDALISFDQAVALADSAEAAANISPEDVAAGVAALADARAKGDQWLGDEPDGNLTIDPLAQLRAKLDSLAAKVPGAHLVTNEQARAVCWGALGCLAKQRASDLANLLYPDPDFMVWKRGQITAIGQWVGATKLKGEWIPSSEALEDFKSVKHLLPEVDQLALLPAEE